MDTLELRKITKDIKTKYGKTIEELEKKLDELRKEQQEAANEYLKSIFKVGFEFIGARDMHGGGPIGMTVVATNDSGVIVREIKLDHERYIPWECLPYVFDRYYMK